MTTSPFQDFLAAVRDGLAPTHAQALALSGCDDIAAMMTTAALLRDRGHGANISYSRKVFIPLTKLCRDSCHYCTFAQPPRRAAAAYLSPDEVLAIARAGAQAGCHEALFTLGDKPELRYGAARAALEQLGYATTLDYLAAMAELVAKETGLLPHLNPGLMNLDDVQRLRRVSVSQGIMLETAADRLAQKGGPHFGSPDKVPAVRLATIAAAGEAAVPFTSGILIGIGETRAERLEALLALRDLHERYGHIQEIIIQNFRAKPGTRMADAPEPDAADHLWTIAAARIIFGPAMNIQAPPNLSGGPLAQMIAAGINDWGGVSPVTPDHVNPEAPWPALATLADRTAQAGKVLVERLAIYPAYIRDTERWLDLSLRSPVLRAADAEGFGRTDPWIAGAGLDPPDLVLRSRAQGRAPQDEGSKHRSSPDRLARILDQAVAGHELSETDVVALFAARGSDFERVCATADALRAAVSGDRVAYVVNRNINYTNVCYFRCQFCAFSKGRLSANLRGRPYDLALEEIQRRCSEAWERGATEVCLQGGIHPDYTGATYLSICRAIKAVTRDIHIHAFSPLEVTQGAQTLGLSVAAFLTELKAAGLGTLPGTAAEILDDEVRRIICPDKITTRQWLDVIETAHAVGLRTTATIMYGHVEGPEHWARHLLRLRALQVRTGGLTEFVPLPFVPMETPIYLHGRARSGPTYREAILMHAVARLALHPHVTNIQTSWVKMGPEGVKACLRAGANDLGGTLMNESITRAAGAVHGEELPPAEMEALISAIGRKPAQRTTLYQDVAAGRRAASFAAAPLAAPILTPAHRYEREQPKGTPPPPRQRGEQLTKIGIE
ncbi:MAG TPA: 5-amino-6-(D-ribitylamino)uracil--L-tyrosine 4-hydroxyphenyl transferase CofH [Xanthobacteraceae bacterium]|nr:5-amino-6-(D-ribitylamino)uracil--L-tyrosine 4-hydroxyphenyl transferase CofH [Xanthobacteraceae bacterium]